MTQPYQIREATRDDNEGLIELLRRCPVVGPAHVIFDRYPDYFALTRLQGERSTIYVAETVQGEIVGSVVFVDQVTEVSANGERVLRVCDLRTDPAFRRTRMAAEFLEIYRSRLLAGDYHYGLAELLDGGLAPTKTQRILGESIQVVAEGFLDLYQLIPIRSHRQSSPYLLRPAEAKDLASLSSLLAETYHRSLGCPSFSMEWLQRATQQHSSFGLEHLWVAETKQNQIVACVGVWDQKGIRQPVAVRFNRWFIVLLRILFLLGLVWRLPPLPSRGQSLRFAYLRWPAFQVGHDKAMRALLRQLMNKVRESGDYQFLAIGVSEGDRLRPTLRGMFRLKTRVKLYTHRVKRLLGNDTSVVGLSEKTRPFVDVPLI